MAAGTRKKYKALDKFEVLGELGQGAASRILHIRDPESFQHFAMKVVIRRTAEEQKFLDQAKHEFEIAQRFDHPSLLKIYDIRVLKSWFREREVRTLLEFVNGESLESLRGANVPLLVVIFAEAASAVHHMHRRDVFHADLKPNNIMVSQSGQVKVIDFGLAWLRGQKKDRVQGTLGYLAPEQVRHRIANEATDIFNFGATMYRLLTGLVTSSGKPAAQGSFIPNQGILKSAHEMNPAVPRELSDLLDRCCEIKPNKRPESMATVAKSLTGIMQSMQVTSEDLPELLRKRDAVS